MKIVTLHQMWNKFNHFVFDFTFKLNFDMFWKELNSSQVWDGVSNPLPSSNFIYEGREKIIHPLKKFLVEKTILEIDAGKKFFTRYMEDWGYEIKATDFAWDYDNYDVTKKPLTSKFDNVVAIGVLHHILDDNDFYNALKNIKAMVKKKNNSWREAW